MFSVRPFYYASYRDLRDALLSAKQKITTEFMLEFLRRRGVLLSASTSRVELINAIALYPYDGTDLDELCDQLESPGRADRVASIALDEKVDRAIIQTAIDSVREARDGRVEAIAFQKVPNSDRMELLVDYVEVDEGRTLLRQQRPKQGKIEFIHTSEGMKVRFPAAERVSDLASEILEQISKQQPTIVRSTIDLQAFSKGQRTKFFQLLLQKTEGYRQIDVLKVNVNQNTSETEFSTEEEDEEDGAGENVGSQGVEKRFAEKQIRSFLRRCSLDGNGILHNRELKRFLDAGFFISRIVWELRPVSGKNSGPQGQIEALLERPAEGLGFKYQVRGVYSRKKSGKYAITKRKPSDAERDDLLDVVEKAARAAYDDVMSEITAAQE